MLNPHRQLCKYGPHLWANWDVLAIFSGRMIVKRKDPHGKCVITPWSWSIFWRGCVKKNGGGVTSRPWKWVMWCKNTSLIFSRPVALAWLRIGCLWMVPFRRICPVWQHKDLNCYISVHFTKLFFFLFFFLVRGAVNIFSRFCLSLPPDH